MKLPDYTAEEKKLIQLASLVGTDAKSPEYNLVNYVRDLTQKAYIRGVNNYESRVKMAIEDEFKEYA